MTAWKSAKAVEALAFERLKPFLKEKAHDGQLVVTNKGALAQFVQEVIGDIILNTDAETMWTVELKAEHEHTGNLFLETWSNKNLNDRANHSMHGSNRGWLEKLRSDLLFYYFLDTDRLYIINLFRLKQWAFGKTREPGRIYDFPEKAQGKYVQLNDTHGRCVPVAVLMREVGVKLVHPRQLDLIAA